MTKRELVEGHSTLTIHGEGAPYTTLQTTSGTLSCPSCACTRPWTAGPLHPPPPTLFQTPLLGSMSGALSSAWERFAPLPSSPGATTPCLSGMRRRRRGWGGKQGLSGRFGTWGMELPPLQDGLHVLTGVKFTKNSPSWMHLVLMLVVVVMVMVYSPSCPPLPALAMLPMSPTQTPLMVPLPGH